MYLRGWERGLGFGVWGLGFGVWVLGFGVWGLTCGLIDDVPGEQQGQVPSLVKGLGLRGFGV